MNKTPTFEELEQKVRQLERENTALRQASERLRLLSSITENMLDSVVATKQRHMEYELKESEKKWRNILVNTPQIGLSLDKQGKIIFTNRHFLQLTGWSEEEVIGRDWFELCIPPEIRDEIETVFRSVMNGKGKLDLTTHENEILTRSGDRRIVAWSNVLTRNVQGGIIDVTCLGVDLTERKRAEARLKESESRYRTIFENNLNPIAIIDNEGHYLEANRAFYNFTQTEPQTLLNRSVFEFSPPNRKKKQEGEHRPAWSSGGTIETEYLIGDQIKTLELSVTPIQYKGRKAVVGVGVDTTKRKKSEAAQLESEEKFRDLSSMLPQIVFETDSRFNLTFVNKNAFSTFLYTEKEFESGLNALQMISPSDQQRAAEMVNQIMEGGIDGIGNEYLAVKKDGTEFPVIIYSSRILRNGVPAGIRGVMVDISDRKQAEEKLRESEEKFRLTFDASPDSVNINRLQDGLYVDINRGFTALTGYSREDVIGKTSVEINIWDDIDDRKKLTDALKSSGVCENLQAQFRRKDGSVTAALMSSRVIHLQGEPHTISITRDISERIKADSVIRENELKFRSLFELSPQAIALTEIASGELLDVNGKLCELTKYSREEIIGKTTTEVGFYSEKDRRIFVSELMTSGQVNGLEMDFFAKDGTVLTAMMFARPIKIVGEPLLLTIFHDITEQKHLQKNIAKAQRMEAIGNLAGGIAHDFNNLLFPITGMAELLTEDLDPGSVQYENVQEILKAGMRGSDLVKQILAFSRQSEHKMIPVRVQQVLREVVKLSRATIPTNIEIWEDIQKECGLVLADPTQLHQIGMNLITNAYHAIERSDGKISVTLKETDLGAGDPPDGSVEPGRYALLTVSDTGMGIDPGVMNKIFEPYFTTKEQGKGTGLGLAVVYGIVKDHGGAVAVDSQIRKGTTFKVYLPLIDKAVALISDEASQMQPTGSERLLLVDDEQSVVAIEKQMLERLGYHVTERTSSLEAFKAFKANPFAFDLVVSDMTMPNMTGDRLAGELISIRPNIPVIICTGFSERINKDKATALGIKGFLMKPVIKSEMARMVRKALDEAKG